MQFCRGQGALEYLLLIGGAVVVAVIVIYILISLARTTGEGTNETITEGYQHIQGALGGDGGPVCGNGTCEVGETEAECPADCGCNYNTNCEPERGETLVNCSSDCR